jgi:hypothetical protein
MNVYPNPVKNVLSVFGTKAGQEIRIVDLNGQVQGIFTGQGGTTNINTSNWNAGTYLIGIEGQNIKVIKN